VSYFPPDQTDYKNSVRAATTGAITLSGTQTIDGVSVVAKERVLVKDQGTGSENGIYRVSASTWTRALDADAANEVTSGMQVHVSEGSVNGDTIFELTTNDPITIGSTALVFTSLSGGTASYANDEIDARILSAFDDAATDDHNHVDAYEPKDRPFTRDETFGEIEAALDEQMSSLDNEYLRRDLVSMDDATLSTRVFSRTETDARIASAIEDYEHNHVFRTNHTFAIADTVVDNTTPVHFISLAVNQSVTVLGAYVLTSAGSTTVNVRKNGTGITGLSALAATTSSGFTAATTPPSLINGDKIDVVISSTSGAADLSVTVVLEHTI